MSSLQNVKKIWIAFVGGKFFYVIDNIRQNLSKSWHGEAQKLLFAIVIWALFAHQNKKDLPNKSEAVLTTE